MRWANVRLAGRVRELPAGLDKLCRVERLVYVNADARPAQGRRTRPFRSGGPVPPRAREKG